MATFDQFANQGGSAAGDAAEAAAAQASADELLKQTADAVGIGVPVISAIRRSVIEEVVVDVNLAMLAHELKLAGADAGSLPSTRYAPSP